MNLWQCCLVGFILGALTSAIIQVGKRALVLLVADRIEKRLCLEAANILRIHNHLRMCWQYLRASHGNEQARGFVSKQIVTYYLEGVREGAKLAGKNPDEEVRETLKRLGKGA